MRNADPRGPQGSGVWPLRHKNYDSAGFDLEFRSTLLAYAVKDRKAGDDHIGEWIYDEETLGDVIGALCWPNDGDKRSIPGWSWVWPSYYGKKGAGPGSVATPGAGGGASIGGSVATENPANLPGGRKGAEGNPGDIGPAGNPQGAQGFPQFSFNNQGSLSALTGIPGIGPGSAWVNFSYGGNSSLSALTGMQGIGTGSGFAGFSFGGSSSLSALTGMQGVGFNTGFAGFSFGGSSSTSALTGIPGIGFGSGFPGFITPADPYRNPFGIPPSGNGGKNAGGLPGVGGPAGQPGPAGGADVGGPDPATLPANGDKQAGCGTMPKGQAALRPIRDESWQVDDRFKEIQPNFPDDWPKLPKGIYGLTVCATEEKRQVELFFPASPFFGIAVNAAGDPMTGSDVCDENASFEIDKNAKAKLQSAFWVIKKPLGGANAIAINYGDSGCGDTEGGYIIDRGEAEPAPPAPAPVASGGSSTGGSGYSNASAYPVGPGLAPGEGGVGGGGNGAAGGVDKSAAARIVARMSKNKGGPIWVGSKKDKHVVGSTQDGMPITKAHIWTGALFRKNKIEDGPILFEDVYRSGKDQKVVVPCHLSWNHGAQMWMIWSTTLMYPPEPPPPYPPPPYPPPSPPYGDPVPPPPWDPPPPPPEPPPPPPTGDNTPPMPPDVPTIDTKYQNDDGTKTPMDEPRNYSPPVISSGSDIGDGMVTANAVNPILAAAFAFAAQDFTTGAVDTGLFSPASSDSIAKQGANAVTGVMSAFGACGGAVPPAPSSPTPPSNTPASGDPVNYTTSPKGSKMSGNAFPSKWNSGTSNGGMIFHPPETDLRDAKRGMLPRNTPVSTSYMMVTTGSWFGAGIPQLENGSIKSGYSWGFDSATGDLIFRSHVSGNPSDIHNVMRLTQTTQTIQWYSGFTNYGELVHANTGNRSYTFPDISGTVPICSTVVSDNAPGTLVTNGHTGGSGPAAAGISKWLKVRASDGLDYYVAGYR